MSLEKLGTIAFRADHEDADWLTNNKLYRFASPRQNGISIEVVKHSDRTLEITLSGTAQSDTRFRHLVPYGVSHALHVAVAWNGPDVRLYLQGELTQMKTVEQSP